MNDTTEATKQTDENRTDGNVGVQAIVRHTTLDEKIKELVRERSEAVENELIMMFRWVGVDPFQDLDAGTLTRFYCKGREAFGYYLESKIDGTEWPFFKYEKRMVPLLEVTTDEIVRHYLKLRPEDVRTVLTVRE